MCRQADRQSIPSSLSALRDAITAVLVAIGVLLIAVATLPARELARRRGVRAVPARLGHVDVQIHLEDHACIRDLRRTVRQTLRRAARTWAPLPLPVDRVVVGLGFPSTGRVDVYDGFPDTDGAAKDNPTRPLVVISLGLREGERDMEPPEIAGALAARIQAVVDDRYRLAKTSLVATATATAPAPAPAQRDAPAGVRPIEHSPAVPRRAPGNASDIAQPDGAGRMGATELPRLQDLLATVQEGQPLRATGPTSNHSHP